MGIFLANMVAIGLPSAAQLSPFTVGTHGPLDLAAWTFDFLLVDGKFRALFAIMFGASMLLVMESAELDGRDGFAAHRRRMLWLAAFGLAHHVLLWSGDILLPLALAGLIATALVRHDTLTLIKWALGLLALQWAVDLLAVLPSFALRNAALAPNAGGELGRALAGSVRCLRGAGQPGRRCRDRALRLGQLCRHSRGAAGRAGARLRQHPVVRLPELLAFMALGMAMLKGGFLSAQWTVEQYRATWRRAYLVGLVPMAGLAAWVLVSHDPLRRKRPFRLVGAAAPAARGRARRAVHSRRDPLSGQ